MLKPQEDDLFRESAMSFGEHLEELRRRLYRAIVWLAIGFAFGVLIGKQVVHLIESPLTKALDDYYTTKAKEALLKKYGTLPPEALDLFQAGYVPELLSIQPARALDALSHDAGGEALATAARFTVYRLVAADLIDPHAVAETLQNASTDENHATGAYRIWQQLHPAERLVVAAIAADMPHAVTAGERQQLAEALNRLLGDADLYAEKTFSDGDLDATASEDLGRRATLAPTELQRLNWSLLKTVAPDAIAPPHPYLASLSVWRPGSEDERIRPKAMGTMEAFIIFIKAALLSGLILFSPLIFRELWMFVAAGLYPHERRYVYIFLPFSVLLFISGALLAFFAAFPPVLHFLLSFNDWLGIPPDMRISEWLSFVLFLPLAFGLGFQLPLVMLFLNRIGLVSVSAYLRGTRLAILVIFVAAPILNPSPDPYSMLLLALPMTTLYFVGILLCRYASRRRPAGLGGVGGVGGE